MCGFWLDSKGDRDAKTILVPGEDNCARQVRATETPSGLYRLSSYLFLILRDFVKITFVENLVIDGESHRKWLCDSRVLL